MSQQQITPHKVTKPIQLLAAWLAGLVLTNGTFLSAATLFGAEAWERGALVIASILNVPAFLAAIFLLQTRFRAELQEDSYYAQYLSKKTDEVVRVTRVGAVETKLETLEKEVLAISRLQEKEANEKLAPKGDGLDWAGWAFAINDHHPQYKEIRAALRQAGMPIKAVFGKVNGSKAPDKWVVAINRAFGAAQMLAILRVLSPYSIDAFEVWEPEREAEESEDVYIGAYGGREVIAFTDELREMLEKDISWQDVAEYMESNKAV